MKWLALLSSQGLLFRSRNKLFFIVYYKINSWFDKINPASVTDTLYTVNSRSGVLYFLSFDPRRGRDPLRSTGHAIIISLYEEVSKAFLKGDGLIKIWLYIQKTLLH